MRTLFKKMQPVEGIITDSNIPITRRKVFATPEEIKQFYGQIKRHR